MKKVLILMLAALMLTSCGTAGPELKQPPQTSRITEPVKADAEVSINAENPLGLALTDGFPDTSYLANPIFDTDEFLDGYDWVQYVPTFGSQHSFCESENAYYFSIFGDKIYYCDKASGISGPLCSKPECAHATEDRSCDATIVYGAGLSYYNGKLWWLDSEFEGETQKFYIYSADLDGRNRKKVRDTGLDRYDFTKNGVLPELCFHRGFMYAAFKSYDVTDAVQSTTIVVTQTPLSKSGETVELLYRQIEGVSVAEAHIMPWRNKIIIPTEIYLPSEDGKPGLSMVSGVYEYDTENAAMRIISTGKYSEVFNCYGVNPNGEVLAGGAGCRIYRLTENGAELLFEPESGADEYQSPDLIFTDKNIIFCKGGLYTGEDGTDSTESRILVLDYGMNTVADFTFSPPNGIEPKGNESYLTYLEAADSDRLMFRIKYFLFNENTRKNDFNYTYRALVPLTGGEAEVFMTKDETK